MTRISPLYASVERNRQEADAQLAAEWLERFAQIQADLKRDIRRKVNGTELFYAMQEVSEQLKYFRDDHAIPELIDFTEVPHD